MDRVISKIRGGFMYRFRAFFGLGSDLHLGLKLGIAARDVAQGVVCSPGMHRALGSVLSTI